MTDLTGVLLQIAGIRRVVQCHGSFATATCTKCRHRTKADDIKEDILEQVSNVTRPNVENVALS